MSIDPNQRSEARERRRDFLGLAAVWAFACSVAAAALGSLRLLRPNVFPEPTPRFTIGQPSDFPPGTVMTLPRQRLWVFSDEKGLYAISSICTHLGCVVHRKEGGGFICPCHGSEFDQDGRVTKGAAPEALHWLELSLAPGGQLMVDSHKKVPLGTRFVV